VPSDRTLRSAEPRASATVYAKTSLLFASRRSTSLPGIPILRGCSQLLTLLLRLAAFIQDRHGVFSLGDVDATVVRHAAPPIVQLIEARRPQTATSLSAQFVFCRFLATCLYETPHGAEAAVISTRRNPQGVIPPAFASS